MIGIWYNPNKNKFYTKYVRTAFIAKDYKVGYKNSYGHELVGLFMLEKNRLIICDSWDDYYTYKRDYYKPKQIKKRIIRKIIKFLERRCQ